MRFRITSSDVVHGQGLVARVMLTAGTELFVIRGTVINARRKYNEDIEMYSWTNEHASILDYCQCFPSSCDPSRLINASVDHASANCDVKWVNKLLPVLYVTKNICAGDELLVFYNF